MHFGARCLRSIPAMLLSGLAATLLVGGCPVTYQGQLLENGEPANGNYDFEFAVYDAAEGGNQIGPTVAVNDVPVRDGLFTVHIDVRDIDLSEFDPSKRPYLELAVEGERLTPRQPITMTPYAALAAYVRDPNVARLNADQTFTGSSTFAGDCTLGDDASDAVLVRGRLAADGAVTFREGLTFEDGGITWDVQVPGSIVAGTFRFFVTVMEVTGRVNLGDDPSDTVVCSGSVEARELRVAEAVTCARVATSESCALGDDPSDTVVCSGAIVAHGPVRVAAAGRVLEFGQDGDGFLEAGDDNGDGVPDFIRISDATLETNFKIDFSNDSSLDDGFDLDGKTVTVKNRELVVAPDAAVTFSVEGVAAVAPYVVRLGITDPRVADTAIEVDHQGVGDGLSVRLDNPTNPAAAVHGVNLSPAGFAGLFQGNVHVDGCFSASEKQFRIDHPLDPSNKFLVHACVESPERKNVYDGLVTTDDRGEAEVVLPAYFEALNGDFRYQLTVIGQFAQAIVAREIQNNRFWIRTDKPRVKVSWQVTGVRRDAYALQVPLQVEQAKSDSDRKRDQDLQADCRPADRTEGRDEPAEGR